MHKIGQTLLFKQNSANNIIESKFCAKFFAKHKICSHKMYILGRRRQNWDSEVALQMKGQWESNINVWFPFMYSQKWICYFQNRIIMFCLLILTLIYLWEIYIFPGSVCLFCCREICGTILGIYNSLTDTWMWKLGLRLRKFFLLLARVFWKRQNKTSKITSHLVWREMAFLAGKC